MGLFSKEKPVQCNHSDEFSRRLADIKRDNDNRIKEQEFNHKLEVAQLKSDQKLELEQKAFELKHFKDAEVQKLTKELNDAKSEIAVLKKENEMLDKITDLNADVIDVKDVVNKIIDKLPTMNISSISVGAQNAQSSK